MTATNFAVDLRRDGDAVQMRVSGEIDIAAVAHLRRAREEALGQMPTSLIIDLTAVDFIDSSGLRCLLETERALRDTPCRLSIRRPRAAAMQVFTMTGADRHLPFVDD